MWRWLILLGLSACGLQEQPGYLVGRLCIDSDPEPCDVDETCVPHAIREGTFADYRCRSEESLQRFEDPELGTTEAPLAYCDETVTCPGEAQCVVDRVRQGDMPTRPRVCRAAVDILRGPT